MRRITPPSLTCQIVYASAQRSVGRRPPQTHTITDLTFFCDFHLQFRHTTTSATSEAETTHIMPSMFDTRLCASPFLPCFINRFVNSSNMGSTFGGNASSSYPLTDAAARSGVCADGWLPDAALAMLCAPDAAGELPVSAVRREPNVASRVGRSVGVAGSEVVGAGSASGKRRRDEDANDRMGYAAKDLDAVGARERRADMSVGRI